jgi:DNA-binding response OmpR family regulator
MRILLVEDEIRLARSYQRNLERAGHFVELLHDGESAYERLVENHDSVDVVVLDVLLPGMSGIELCRRLRRDRIRTPILLLTALDQTEDKVMGLDAGADDYLSKPFPFDELLARLRALGRRPHVYDPVANATLVQVGDLVIDELQHEVYKAGRPITLTPREFALLAYLARNANRVMTRDQLLSHVWPDGTEAGSNVLDTYIHHLRDKLQDGTGAKMLHTVRGVGYALRVPKPGAAT